MLVGKWGSEKGGDEANKGQYPSSYHCGHVELTTIVELLETKYAPELSQAKSKESARGLFISFLAIININTGVCGLHVPADRKPSVGCYWSTE